MTDPGEAADKAEEKGTPAGLRPVSFTRRRRVLAVVAAGALLVSVGGLGGALLVKSPQQIAAEAAPPEPSVITAPVERRTLSETVVLRGAVAPGKTVDVPAPEMDEGKAVVTRKPARVGKRIRAGTVVAEVSGRPIIALPGRIPSYRDIRAGVSGPDVKQLQAALRSLGYGIADRSGVYGTSTRAAVTKLFKDRGYAPAIETEDEPEGDGEEPGSGTRPSMPARMHEPADEPAKKPGEKPAKKPKRVVMVKAGEVVFVPKFPARVTQVKAGLGAEAKGTVLTLATGDLEVRGSLSPSDRKLVKEGMPVTILDEKDGTKAEGTVARIGSFQSGGGEGEGEEGEGQEGAAAAPGHPVVVRGAEPLPEKFAGQDVRLTIEAASTDGPVLVVPSSAVYAAADGSTQVIRQERDGTQRRVTVTVGANGDGYVEVRSPDLAPNDRVVIGS